MSDDLRQLCERLVPEVLARRGYKLVVDQVAFIAEVFGEAQARLPNNRRSVEKIVEDAVVNRYGFIWHEACRAAGTLRQRQAFEELHHYLYPIALHHAGREVPAAEDSAQAALFIVWQQLDRIKDPGAFARFASVIVYHEVLRRLKETDGIARESDGLQLEDMPDDPNQSKRTLPESQAQPTSGVTIESRAALEVAIRDCLPKAPYAAVIIELFLNEKGFVQVADELHTTVQNVWVLKSRALKQLKKCQNLLDVLEELL